MKVDWANEKDTVSKLISDGVPYERIGRMYGVTGSAVKKAAKKLGIELEAKRKINQSEHFNKREKPKCVCLNCGEEFESKRNSKDKFCSRKCSGEYRYKQHIERWKNGEEDGINGKYGIAPFIRRYFFDKYDCKCQKCGWGETNKTTGMVPLQIHHVDGDYTNNKEENLQLLCPNCHSLTDTYMSLNKNGRKDRAKYDK